MDINQIMTSLEAKHPGESEYLQAVKEVCCWNDVLGEIFSAKEFDIICYT